MEDSKNYSFFQHRECECFPCHPNANEKTFNCIFCYCPLYFLDGVCEGNYRKTAEGIKDCTNCLIPHSKGGYSYIQKKLKDYFQELKNSVQKENEIQ